MFIQTKPVENSTELEFFPADKVYAGGPLQVLAGTAAHVAFLLQVAVPAPTPRVNVLRPGLPRERRRRQIRIDA